MKNKDLSLLVSDNLELNERCKMSFAIFGVTWDASGVVRAAQRFWNETPSKPVRVSRAAKLVPAGDGTVNLIVDGAAVAAYRKGKVATLSAAFSQKASVWRRAVELTAPSGARIKTLDTARILAGKKQRIEKRLAAFNKKPLVRLEEIEIA